MINDLKDVSVAILVGGLGTRLRSKLFDKPKVLAEIHERPFLKYLLDQLNKTGFRKVVLCTGYLGDQIREKFGSTYGHLKLHYSQESFPLGTAGALRLALTLLKSDTVMIMNGDSLCDCDLKKFLRFHKSKKADVSLLLTKVSGTSRFGRVNIERGGRIVSFEEKGQDGAGWINGGIYLISRVYLSEIPQRRAVSFEKEMFPKWVNRNFYGYQSKGRFIDIGTPKSYEEAEKFFSKI